MVEPIERAEKANLFIRDASLPKWRRLKHGIEAVTGIEPSEHSDAAKGKIDDSLAGVNRARAPFPLGDDAMYENLGDDVLDGLLDSLDAANTKVIAAELDRIVVELSAGFGELPEKAIQEAREHRELMIPKLIDVLRDATAAARAGDKARGNAHFFAVFLLSEFRAQEAFPAILEAFSLPGELPFDLFGDAVHSTLARILAQFAGDRPEVADGLIRNAELNEFVRWDAAQCYVHLVRDQRMTRDEAVERLRQHLRWAVAEEDDAVIGGIICELVSFAPAEALADIEEAFRRGLVDVGLVDLECVEQSIAEGDERVRRELTRCPATGIEDTITELRHWACFAEKPAPRPDASPYIPQPYMPQPHFSVPGESLEPVSAPVSSRDSRVGRNEPCPCGSGKKFKKCCGGRR